MARRRAVMRVVGPLEQHALPFRVWLRERGYHASTVEEQVWLMGHLSRWLAAQELSPARLQAVEVERFQAEHRLAHSHLTGSRALRAVLGYLREVGVVPEPVIAGTAVDVLCHEYAEYLARERGLVPGSVLLRERVARLFLSSLPGPLDEALGRLSPGDVTAFVVGQCGAGRRGVAWAKTLTSGLRSLLVFLHVTGRVGLSLAGSVPSVAGWRLSALPRGIEAEQLQGLLAGCDRSRPVGRRDYAILMLSSRLGLRACEIVALSLDDIDWRGGSLVVRGKGGQIDRLPLAHDVGDALASYLLGHRDRRGFDRAVFLRMVAPHGPLSASAIGGVMRDACRRAGIATIGSHRLRHTLATELLGAGAGLGEIAPVLRHTNLSSTAIYAKVHRPALRSLARPWPTGDMVT